MTMLPDLHRYSWDDYGISIDVQRFMDDRREGVMAEITVLSDLPPRGTVLLHHARLNLMSAQSRATAIKAIRDQTTPGWHSETDFAAMVQYVCSTSTTKLRTAIEVFDLAVADAGPRRPNWLINPLIDASGATVIYATGGVAKSVLALGMAMTLSTGLPILGYNPSVKVPVLYLDWEADLGTHQDRMKAIARGYGCEVPHLDYARLMTPLRDSLDGIRRVVAAKGIGFVVIDSLGASRGGEPESAEDTIKFFNAMRALQVPWLGIDHINKTDAFGTSRRGGNQTPTAPFGSIYTRNLSRLMWYVDRADGQVDSEFSVSMVNTKANNAGRRKNQALTLRFGTIENEQFEGDQLLDTITFSRIDEMSVAEFAAKKPAKERILNHLVESGVGMTAEAIAAALEMKVTVVRPRLTELAHAAKVTQFSGVWRASDDALAHYTGDQKGSLQPVTAPLQAVSEE